MMLNVRSLFSEEYFPKANVKALMTNDFVIISAFFLKLCYEAHIKVMFALFIRLCPNQSTVSTLIRLEFPLFPLGLPPVRTIVSPFLTSPLDFAILFAK